MTERFEIHHFHHFDNPLIVQLQDPPQETRPAVRAAVSIKEKAMSAQSISVDAVGEKAVVTFFDDHDDETPAPDGTVTTFTGDNDAVATVDATSGQLTLIHSGQVTVNASSVGADGNPLQKPDGSGPFDTPDPVVLTVDPGAAVGERVSVTP